MTNPSHPFPVQKLPVFKAILLGLLVVLVAGALTGCFPAATPAATETVPPPPPPTETMAPPPTATSTMVPTDTPTEVPPTATLVPTDTATPIPALAIVQDGTKAWCVSYRDPYPMGGVADAPSYARLAKVVNNKLRLNVSRGSCTFVFAFNQAVPAGAELQVLDSNGIKAWTKAALKPVDGDPNRGFAVLTNQMLNDSAYWEVTYPFALVATDGTILWKNDVVVFKTFPGLCWEGSTPDPVTLFCPMRDTDFIPHYTPPAP